MAQVLHFYATKNDLLPVFDLADKGLQYVRDGHHSVPEPEKFSSALELPNLGFATNESAISCKTYLVCDRDTVLVPQRLTLVNGTKSFYFDQFLNPKTFVFGPGGIWRSDILLYGRLSNVSEDPASIRLMKRFASPIRKNFTRINVYYVGPDALEMLKSGKRLTIAEQSPREFDLSSLERS